MTAETAKLKSLLNASGFAFQLAVEAAVRARPGTYGWAVSAREHPWKTNAGTGFIDLVISSGRAHLVVECKRPRNATWMFLMTDEKQMARSHARICWTDTVPLKAPLVGWDDVQVYPASPESNFCAVRGQGEKDAPLLERLASSVVESVDGLAADLLTLDQRSATSNVIIPVIVTTAALVLASFRAQDVDLTSGELDAVSFTTIPHIRFRKSLAASGAPDDYEATRLRDLSAAAERTVFVVNSMHFTQWLEGFQLGAPSFGSPWETARRRADANGP